MHPVMRMLVAGVPVSLLVDLLSSEVPFSREIYWTEVADDSWIRLAPQAAAA
ncbi:MAG: hypothetical protein M3Z02_03300 [Actinomycetota bacterium]|nr:hypothetical protein [Actinomycetota bacterium]